MASELTIRTAIVRWLRAQGAYVLVTTGVSTAGTPDLLVCYRGCFIALEVKALGGRTTPLQEVHLELVGGAGGAAAVVRSVESVASLLQNLPPLVDDVGG